MGRTLQYFSSDDWEIALLLAAECLGKSNLSWPGMKKIYETDPLYFYKQAKKSPYWGKECSEWTLISSLPLETEQNIIKCLGVLRAADDDEFLTKKIIKIIKLVWPEGYEVFRKVNNKTFDAYDRCQNTNFNNITPYLIETLYPSATGDKSRLDNLFALSQKVFKLYGEKFDDILEEYPSYDLKPNQKLLVSVAQDPVLLLGAGWEQVKCLNNSEQYDTYFYRVLEFQKAQKTYNEQIGIYRDLLYEQSASGVSQLVEDMLGYFDIDLGRMFDTKLDYSSLAEIAARFAGYAKRTSKSGYELSYSSRCADNDAALHFDSERFIFCYYILCILKNYVALKKKCRSLQTEEQILEVDYLNEQLQEKQSLFEDQQRINEGLMLEIEKLKKRLSEYEKNDRSVEYEHDSVLSKQLEIQQKELEELRQDKVELAQLRSILFHRETVRGEIVESPAQLKDISTLVGKKRIAVVGGHIRMQNQLKKDLPDFTILDGTLKSQDFKLLENMDHVFLITSYMSHSVYYNLMHEVKSTGTQYSYIDKSNAAEIEQSIFRYFNDQR